MGSLDILIYNALQYFIYLEDRMKTPTNVEWDVPPEADKSCRTCFDFLPLRFPIRLEPQNGILQ